MTLAKLAGGLALAFGVVAAAPVKALRPSSEINEIPWQADSHIVVDANRDITLDAHAPDELRYPASLTKLMTLAVLFDSLESGQIALDTALPVSARASYVSHGGIKLGLQPGDKITVEDAITAMTVKSFNDVAQVVAENLGGSQTEFVRLMNQKAQKLGLASSHFTNATGLPDKQQVTTARDMATLCDYLVEQHSKFYHFFGATEFIWKGKTHNTHNKLMTQYQGMDGLKTGYIRASGFNLAASAEKNGERVISIVFGHPNASSRNKKAARLLDLGFLKINDNKMPEPEALIRDAKLLFADIRSIAPKLNR